MLKHSRTSLVDNYNRLKTMIIDSNVEGVLNLLVSEQSLHRRLSANDNELIRLARDNSQITEILLNIDSVKRSLKSAHHLYERILLINMCESVSSLYSYAYPAQNRDMGLDLPALAEQAAIAEETGVICKKRCTIL